MKNVTIAPGLPYNNIIGFEMSMFVDEAIRGRCASLTILTATVWEICGGQTHSSIIVLY